MPHHAARAALSADRPARPSRYACDTPRHHCDMKESTKEMLVFLLTGIGVVLVFAGWKLVALFSG